MLISFKCPCGNTDIKQAKEYDGMLGYDAVICKKCGRIHDENGIHERETDKKSIMYIKIKGE
jgi:hypothetical protein